MSDDLYWVGAQFALREIEEAVRDRQLDRKEEFLALLEELRDEWGLGDIPEGFNYG